MKHAARKHYVGYTENYYFADTKIVRNTLLHQIRTTTVMKNAARNDDVNHVDNKYFAETSS